MSKKTFYIVLAVIILLLIGAIYNHLSFIDIAPGTKDEVPKYYA
ncbi:hypothetical protein [Priestia aryabhattai]